MPDVWLPPTIRNTPLAQAYIDAWVETGDTNAAWEAVRAHPQYDNYFPGNKRDDGTVIYDESTYRSVIESFEDTLLSININPDLFANRFGEMVAGYVSPNEFANRIEAEYEGIINQAPEVAQWYADNGFAYAPSREAIIASVLDPDIGDAILSGEIAMAQVGGQASKRGFDIGVNFARQLTQAGLDTSSEASSFFALAQGAIPVLQVLARRNGDPNDEFNLEDFTNAQLFEDPEQRQRMRRYMAQERARFTDSVAGVGLFRRSSQTGGILGIAER